MVKHHKVDEASPKRMLSDTSLDRFLQMSWLQRRGRECRRTIFIIEIISRGLE